MSICLEDRFIARISFQAWVAELSHPKKESWNFVIELTLFFLQLVVNVHQPQQHNICKNDEVYQKISHHLIILLHICMQTASKSIIKKTIWSTSLKLLLLTWGHYIENQPACHLVLLSLATASHNVDTTTIEIPELPEPKWIQRLMAMHLQYLSVCDKWYLIFQLYANVWSQGYPFLPVHLWSTTESQFCLVLYEKTRLEKSRTGKWCIYSISV